MRVKSAVRRLGGSFARAAHGIRSVVSSQRDKVGVSSSILLAGLIRVRYTGKTVELKP